MGFVAGKVTNIVYGGEEAIRFSNEFLEGACFELLQRQGELSEQCSFGGELFGQESFCSSEGLLIQNLRRAEKKVSLAQKFSDEVSWVARKDTLASLLACAGIFYLFCAF